MTPKNEVGQMSAEQLLENVCYMGKDWDAIHAELLRRLELAAPEPSSPSVGAQEAELVRLKWKVMAADKMARVADDWVQRGLIDSRSALADARLDYGKPFEYEPTSPQAEELARRIAEAIHSQMRPADRIYYDPEKFAEVALASLSANTEQKVSRD